MSKTPKLRFPEFKEEWKLKRIEEVTTYVDYRGKTPNKTESGVFLVTAKNIKNGYIDYEASREFISQGSYEETMRRGIPQKGDVLFTTEAPLGNVAQVDREDIALAQRVIKFSGKANLDNTYFKYFLLSDNFQKALLSKAIGTTVLGIQGKVLHKMEVSFPAFLEQEKISSFFSLIDEKIEKQEKKVEALQEYKKGMMQKIFSQEIRFKDESGKGYPEWEEKKLSEVSNYTSSNVSMASIEEFHGDNIYPIYNANQIYMYIDKYESEEPYISIIKDGAGVGRLFLCEPKSSVIGTMGYIKAINNCLLQFLYYRLQKVNFIKHITGSTIPHVYYKDYKNEILLLPSLEEQKKIASFLTNLDKKLNKEQEKIDLLNQFKKGLLQQMFV